MIFSTLDWARVQPGLAWHEPNAIQGSVGILDASGLASSCKFDLRVNLVAEGHERLTGTICQSLAGHSESCVDMRLDLVTDAGMHLTKLVIGMKELEVETYEMTVSLASAAALTHWLVHYLALKLSSGWLLQLEFDNDNLSDRAASRLLEELLLVCELAAESLDDCAGILLPLSAVS